MKHISYSELKTWAECPYKRKLSYQDRVKKFIGNQFTAFGRALHFLCENLVYDKVEDPEDFFNLSLSRFSQKEIDSSRKLAKECVGSDYVKCFASNEMPSQGSLLGWPSQAKFKCIK